MSSDTEIARAQALGRLAGKAGAPLVCPYPHDRRMLRARWALAYAEARAGVSGVRTKLRRWWRA